MTQCSMANGLAKHNGGLDSGGSRHMEQVEGSHEVLEAIKGRNFCCVMKGGGSKSCV